MADINLSGSVSTTGTAILGRAAVVFASDADHTLSVPEYTNNFLKVTSGVTLTATRNLIAPLVEGQSFVVQNLTTGGRAIVLVGTSGTGIAIASGATVSVVCDGTNYLATTGGGSPSGPVLVYRPAGPANAPNVFTSFSALMTARAAIQGPWILQTQAPGLFTPVTIPVGASAYDWTDCTIVNSTITLASGLLFITDRMNLKNTQLTASTTCLLASACPNIFAEINADTASVVNGASANVPLAQADTAGSQLIIILSNASSSDGGGAALTGGSFSLILFSQSSAINLPDTGSNFIELDATCTAQFAAPDPANWVIERIASNGFEYSLAPSGIGLPTVLPVSFTSWALLLSTLTEPFNAQLKVFLPVGFGGAAHIPSGTWSTQGTGLEMTGGTGNGFPGPPLILDNGAVLNISGIGSMSFKTLIITSNSAGPVIPATGNDQTVSFDRCVLTTTAAAPIGDSAGGLVLDVQGSTFGDGTNPVISVSGIHTLVVDADNSTFENNWANIEVGSTIIVNATDSVSIGTVTGAGTLTVNRVSRFGGPIITVATGAALTAFDVTGVPNGTQAIVTNRSTYWSLGPAGTAVSGYTLPASDGRLWSYFAAAAPQINAQVPAWFVSSGGSDDNTGTSSGAPLATSAEIIRRWGQKDPEINTSSLAVIVHFLTANTEPNVFNPVLSNGASFTLTAALPAADFTGTLNVVTPKSRTGNQALQSTFTTTTGAVAAQMLLVNSTRGSSRAFAQRNVSGGIWQISQPFTPYVLGGGFPFPSEVDTWVSGDAITGYVLQSVVLCELQPNTESATPSLTSLFVVHQINVPDMTGANFDSISVGGSAFVAFTECSVSRITGWNAGATGALTNCAITAAVQGAINIGVQGGYYTATSVINSDAGLEFGLDVIVGNPNLRTCTFGFTCIDNAVVSSLTGNSNFVAAGIVYGPGTLNVIGSLGYQGSATGQLNCTLQLNGQGTGYSNDTSAGLTAVHGGIVLTAANLDAAAGAAGFGGYAYGGGAYITNGAQP